MLVKQPSMNPQMRNQGKAASAVVDADSKALSDADVSFGADKAHVRTRNPRTLHPHHVAFVFFITLKPRTLDCERTQRKPHQ